MPAGIRCVVSKKEKKKCLVHCLANKSSVNISPYHQSEAKVAVMNPVVKGSVLTMVV